MKPILPHVPIAYLLAVSLAGVVYSANAEDTESPVILYHDAHLHLTNYIQEGVTMSETLDLVGDRVGRITVMGIPLQQKWDYFVSG
ncbi:MAG: hypothetical protein OXG24_03030 [Gammaproteobacteria bacterium]|nr:hypothetical protein [Gammaproteobacteria bacterium]